jgi:hypothetical protein
MVAIKWRRSERFAIAVRASTVVLFVALVGCAGRGGPPALAPLPFATDTARTVRVAEGVWHRYLHVPAGPWAIHVLDVDLSRCNEVVAVKGADSVAGRTRTTELLAWLARHRQEARVVGGSNADFFVLANGKPTGLLVVDGRMMTPPIAQPAFAVDSSGRPTIERFALSGGRLTPFHPRQAVGGHPVLARDSAVVADVDTSGSASFIGRNPRTAVGIGRGGRRLLLAVIDGRQKGYSEGMSLRETANLMLALGARDALNLDGGGSSTLVYGDSAGFHVANHPSDAGGERTVGDALAVVNRCR